MMFLKVPLFYYFALVRCLYNVLLVTSSALYYILAALLIRALDKCILIINSVCYILYIIYKATRAVNELLVSSVCYY